MFPPCQIHIFLYSKEQNKNKQQTKPASSSGRHEIIARQQNQKKQKKSTVLLPRTAWNGTFQARHKPPSLHCSTLSGIRRDWPIARALYHVVHSSVDDLQQEIPNFTIPWCRSISNCNYDPLRYSQVWPESNPRKPRYPERPRNHNWIKSPFSGHRTGWCHRYGTPYVSYLTAWSMCYVEV